MRRIPLAVAGERPLGHVDEFGYLHLPDQWRLEWWIAGDDHWHVPAASASLRQRCVDHTPVTETAIRVPGGDVIWRVAATATPTGGAVVAELANTASIPVAIGIALVAPGQPHQLLARPSVHFTAPARSVAAELGVELLVHPVTHGSTFRCSIGAVGPDALPPIDAIVRGWQTLAAQGAQIALGDPVVDDALATARTALLLHAGGIGQAGKRADRALAAEVSTALTLLGLEDDAERFRLAARLKPKRRGLPVVAGDPVPHTVTTDSLELLADPSLAARTVAGIRARLVDDSEPKRLNLLPGATAAWRGHSIDIANLPTNRGPVSFALRWHGELPALLWEAPPKTTIHSPAFDAEWSTRDQSGEALLGASASRRAD